MGGSGDRPSRKRAKGFSRRSFVKGAVVLGAASSGADAFRNVGVAAAEGSVVTENRKAGSSEDEWGSDRDSSIEGFTTQYSVLPGETVQFKVNTPSTNYRIRIYRMGWYGGSGARRIADLTPSAHLPQAQPAAIIDSNGMADCANWAVSASWNVPSDAVSGVYYALFERLDGELLTNHTIFVVRTNAPSDILCQTSEMTWHAYNRWGGQSLYWTANTLGNRGRAVSYNRPFSLADVERENDFFAFEFPLVRWLERNGYDVAYCGDIDTHQQPALLLNRKVFISQGHDEYWSGPMRTNVAAARAAGVNLIFMSGNEVFWKVRLAGSGISGGGDNRSVICYKETHDNAKTDPTNVWTGTWRDPRFSPPGDGGLPENELTGQLFRCILPTDGPDNVMQVPSEFARFRFWRNTSIAQLTGSQVANLGANTLGYEYDVDAENGFRPKGQIQLSSTTVSCPQVLQDHGSTYTAGVVTHNMSMYRHTSGALVWGTGTTQWAYGLDDTHDTDPGTDVNRDMQQATLNVLADMGAQAATKQSDLTAAVKSTDTIPPQSTITSPVQGASVLVGSTVTVTGTAVDSGGGTVASVEVSLDGGTTWKRATGRSQWSFVFVATSPLGSMTIKSRAIDDSCNMETPSAGRSIVVSQRAMPCSMWSGGTIPAIPAADDAQAVEVGVKFRAAIDGFITGLRFYKGAGNNGPHVGHVWSSAGNLLATAQFTSETASGWQTAQIEPLAIAPNTTYVISVFMPVGHYAVDTGYFGSAYDVWPLKALAHGEDGPNALYRYGSSGFPTSSYGASNYWVDVVFNNDNGRTPAVTDRSPAVGLQAVTTSVQPWLVLSEAVTPASIVLGLNDALGVSVPATVAYDAATRTVRLAPTTALQPGTTYTATLSAARDLAGNSIAAPVAWTFTTASAPGVSPATMWDTASVPASPAVSDGVPLELGVKFKVTAAGSITALRYFKSPGSVGPHIGNLWDGVGNRLATVTYDESSSSGWQQANLSTPVPVSPNRIYVASYHTPDGLFPITAGGLSLGRDNVLVAAPPAASVDGNGVYRVGPSGFPNVTGSTSNYWADVVLTLPPDLTAPVVTNVVPAPDLIAVSTTQPIVVSFDESVNPGSVVFSLTGPGGVVPSTLSLDSTNRRATLTPNSPLSVATKYTATVSGATDLAGNSTPTAKTWSFTTVVAPGATPATIWDSSALPAVAVAADDSAVELGVRLRTERTGQITGMRYYKGLGSSGAHFGHLWSQGGALLGTAAFVNETAEGWQQALFPTPVPVTAGNPLVASYHAPAGLYPVTQSFFGSDSVGSGPVRALPADGGNGLYQYGAGGFPTQTYGRSNYWVDVIFDDVSGPGVIARSPVPGATDVDRASAIRVGFDDDVVPQSLRIELRDGGGALVTGTTSYDESTRTGTFVPAVLLASSATYTASVVAAADAAGNPLRETSSWVFVTGSGQISLFGTGTPAVPDVGPDGAVELGVRFTSSVAGRVLGVRYFRSPSNEGPHAGHLWAPDGSLLATADFVGETPSGWQFQAFSSPVDIAPNATYVVSYHAPSGHWSATNGQLSSAWVNGRLAALGGNGVYGYGPGGTLPTNVSGNSTNYWVDLLFEATG